MLKLEKNIYKVYTEIQFNYSNIRLESPLLSDRVRSEKQQVRNLRFPQ